MHLCACVGGNDSLKAENKWTDRFVRLVPGNTTHLHCSQAKVELLVSTVEASLYLLEVLFVLHLGSFSPASEGLFEPKCGR